ncbi:hypothetical protein, conserved [Eimeria brunetti]|uniref:Obg domain-containing protein n=1 Tax=Eimeria brunetti TaxID=51314 RepID=U6LNK9_9EIME|nr:hypothetical protein, conserved [Eimeria brunetti]
MLLLPILLLPTPSSSKRHISSHRRLKATGSSWVLGILPSNCEGPRIVVTAAAWLQQPPSSQCAPRRSISERSSSRCCCTNSSSRDNGAAAFSVDSVQEPPCRLLGGGLSLNPSLIFSLAARRLLQQQLQHLGQPDVAHTAVSSGATAAATSDPVYTPVTVEGGSGGDGSIAFLRLKAAPRSGAAGGSGGRGGCVLLRAVGDPGEAASAPRRLSALSESGCWKAAPGGIGSGQGKTGANGPDILLGLRSNSLVVDVSALQANAATAVRRLLQQQQQDDEIPAEQEEEQQKRKSQQLPPLCCIYFAAPGDTLVAARGGTGGRGNSAFVSNHNRHPLLGETGAPGERRKLLVLHNFSDFVVVGRMQSGKTMLLRALSAAATASAAANKPAHRSKEQSQEGATAQLEGQQQQQQQHQRQHQQLLPAAVPEDVWLPTAEPTVFVIPAPTPLTPTSHSRADEKLSMKQQYYYQKGLVDTLQRGIALASAAPVVAVDTPGFLPPAASPAAAAEQASGSAGQQQEEPVQGLNAATAVLLVVDGSLPDPAQECLMLRQQLLQAGPQLAELPFIVALNKVDLLQSHRRRRQQHTRKVLSLVERVRTQTGIEEVYAVSALRGDGCEDLLRALRKAAGIADLSAEQQQLLLSHFDHQQQFPQQHQEQQKKLGLGAFNLSFLAAYAAAAASGAHSLLLFTVRELQQQEQQPGAALMHRPAAAPPVRVSTASSKKHPYPSFPSLEDPYKWSIVELRGQGKLQRLLKTREALHASPDFTTGRRCFELKGPLVSLLTEPVKFNSEAAKLRLYRQLSALGIVERAFTEYGANIGDYLLVGPVILQLLPLLRQSRGHRTQPALRWGRDSWDIFKTDGLPKKERPNAAAASAAVPTGTEEEVAEGLRDMKMPDLGAASLSPSVRPYTATDPRAVRQRRRARRKISQAIRNQR